MREIANLYIAVVLFFNGAERAKLGHGQPKGSPARQTKVCVTKSLFLRIGEVVLGDLLRLDRRLKNDRLSYKRLVRGGLD
jgi:hypothetical protein